MALNLVSSPEIKAVSFLDSAKSTHFLKLPGERLVAASKEKLFYGSCFWVLM
jgi:hypothetical protein